MSSSKLESDPRGILAGAIRYANTGVRSRQDVRAYLERRGTSPRAITRILETCTTRGLVDDRACARLWAEHWARRGYARAAIHQRLTEKALDEAAITDAIDRVTRDADDEARAKAVLTRRLARGTPLPRSLPAPRTRRSRALPRLTARQAGRLARVLASRGFDPDVIERVLYEAFDSPSSN